MRISDWSSGVCSSDLLTPENANHVITPSDDGKYFVEVYSTIDTAQVALLRDADGRLVAEIDRADLTRRKASGWVTQSVFTLKAREGSTDPYGQQFKAPAFDTRKSTREHGGREGGRGE